MSDALCLRAATPSTGQPSHQSPFAGRIVDGVVIAFAGFTLLANAVVWFGGSAETLLVASDVALLFAGTLFVLGWRLRGRFVPARTDAPWITPTAEDCDDALPARLRAIPIAAAVAALCVSLLTGSLTAWWGVSLMGAFAAFVITARSPVRHAPMQRSRATDVLLLGLGLSFAGAVAIAHRGDADDAFYVNLVVAAIDHPGATLFADDTLHGYADVPMALPVFELLSWELFQASLARLFGTDAVTIVYRWMAPLVGLLVPLAWARLAMRLLPRSWPIAVTLVVIEMLAVGDGLAGYGDFGVLRLHQGKSVLLHVALPLCAAYGIEFGLATTRWHFGRLVAVQIAAVGLSSSGLWLGPAVAALGLVSTLPLTMHALHRNVRVLAMGLASSFYPLALAIALRGATLAAMRDAVHPMDGAAFDGAQLMEHASDLVLGPGAFRHAALFALVAVSGVAASSSMRRFAAVTGLAFLLLFFDPFTAERVASGITGADTYFRVFWSIPLPLFLAALIAGPMQFTRPALLASSWARIAITGVLAISVFGFLPRVWNLSTENEARLGAPGPKLPEEEFAAARIIADHADSGAFVLAPLQIARWIPLIQRHPRPLMVREIYLDRLHARLGAAELERRRALVHYVGGTARPADGPALLADAIDRYPLDVVCVSGRALGWPDLRRVLLDSPLEIAERDADHEIWIRAPTVER